MNKWNPQQQNRKGKGTTLQKNEEEVHLPKCKRSDGMFKVLNYQGENQMAKIGNQIDKLDTNAIKGKWHAP